MGFIGQSVQWKAILQSDKGIISLKDALISTGLPIFGKYIPGKVWIILGRAAYVSEKSGLEVKAVTWLSLLSQLFTLLIGLLIGGVILLIQGNFAQYGWLILIGTLGFSAILFVPAIARLIESSVKRVFKKELSLPTLSIQNAIKILPYYVFTWMAWSLGFYFMITAVAGIAAPWDALAIFPLSASLGIMAVIVPGGLGVREGVIVALLVLTGIDQITAIQISVAQRIWFLIGEGFIFLLGLALNQWRLGFHGK
jgi:uncharacterized membrane protein YbhN (UPF0104 family)